jgi:hypothetical protein
MICNGVGSMMSCNFTASDVFWGQLGGALEAIDSGTTTVVDFSHVLYSPDHGTSIRCYKFYLLANM